MIQVKQAEIKVSFKWRLLLAWLNLYSLCSSCLGLSKTQGGQSVGDRPTVGIPDMYLKEKGYTHWDPQGRGSGEPHFIG